MRLGRVGAVLSVNAQHEASESLRPAILVEAYDHKWGDCAAGKDEVACSNIALPWQHSVLSEPDFLSPFAATLEAQKLRWTLLLKDMDISPSQPTPLRFPKTKKTFAKVQFEPYADILIGSEEELIMSVVRMNHDQLAHWDEKPWYLPPSYREPCIEDQTCVEPLSAKAVSITRSESLYQQYRITDDHGHVEGYPPDGTTAEADTLRGHHPPPELPGWFRHLMEIVPEAEYRAEVEDDEPGRPLHVRTWFLDHSVHLRWNVPRIIELTHDWMRWHEDILAGWADQILIHHAHHIHLVQPDPPRHRHNRIILADLIIVRDSEVPRFAGLVTVASLTDATDVTFSVAASLPAEVSGLMIRTVADADDICQHRRCFAYHGWHELPMTFNLDHRMSNGDSLVIYTTHPHDHEGGEVSHEPAADEEYEATEPAEDAIDDDANPSSNGDATTDVNQSDRRPTQSVREGVRMQTVKLYRLYGPPVQGRVRWGYFEALLLDVARLLGVPTAEITTLHNVQVSPIGDTENDASIIVQMVNDIPDGSTDKLLLLDVETHHRYVEGQYPRSPDTSRQVKRCVVHMVRQHILMLGQVMHYCTVQQDRCLVYHDHLLWSQQDYGVRRFSHGHYVRIVVPEPLNHQYGTKRAISLVEDDVADALDEDNPDPRIDALGSTSPASAPLTFKPAEPTDDIDIPMMLPHHVRQSRPRPRHDGDQRWFADLHQIFAQHGTMEVIDGPTYVYAETWFVHHERHPKCSRPRSIRFDNAWIGWLDELRHLWRDRLDRTQPFSVYVVYPRPRSRDGHHVLAMFCSNKPGHQD